MRPIWILAAVAFASSYAFGAVTDTAGCRWAKKRAAASYSRCRLSADASLSRFGDPAKHADRLGRCEKKLTSAFAKAERRYRAECPTTGDAADVQSFLDKSADGIDAAIDGTPEVLGTLFCGAGTVVDEASGECEAELISSRTDPGPRYDRAGSASRWVRRADMHQPRSQHAVAALNGRVYAVGGPSSLEVYDPASDTWTELPPLPTPRSGLAAVGAGGHLYAIGGWTSPLETVRTVERYDPEQREWARVADLPVAGANLAAVEVDGQIYAIRPDGRVDSYDPASDRWSARAPMLTSNDAVGAGANKGKIYAWGSNGLLGPSLIEEYDPASDEWRALAEAPYFHGWSGPVTMIGGVLIEFGGFNPLNLGGRSSRVQTYWVRDDHFGWGGGTMYAHEADGLPGDHGHAAVGVRVGSDYRIFVVGTGRYTEEYVMSTGLWRRGVAVP